MLPNTKIEPRQLWGPTGTHKTGTAALARCTTLRFPPGGALILNHTYTTILEHPFTFLAPCNITSPGSTGNASIQGIEEPFYASVSPQIYAIATATVISYVLLTLVFITPRTLFSGSPSSGARVLSRRGRNVTYGGPSIVGVGDRPWLQKIATLTVAVSLTIATADTFRVAEAQYDDGFLDSTQLVDEVVGSLEIRVVRIISDTFLWLAQVQTLIRLFPRHREKVTIKWLGFALVSLDTIFSILNSFDDPSSRQRPRSYQDAIPALDYLFELAIGLIYASCVIYYSLSKRRFAFWHPKMRNVCLVAFLSLVAVLIPVVFFVLDVSKPDLAGWGDYIRWVGAAAASVVVWEWVERIESLERDERKGGILGREIFDGDEMLDDDRSGHNDRNGRRRGWRLSRLGESEQQDPNSENCKGTRLQAFRPRIPNAVRLRNIKKRDVQSARTAGGLDRSCETAAPPATRLQTSTPVSRSDTASAASTVYAIRYHDVTNTSALQEDDQMESADTAEVDQSTPTSTEIAIESEELSSGKEIPTQGLNESHGRATSRRNWLVTQHPFKRKRTSPPMEVAGAQHESGNFIRSPVTPTRGIRERLPGLRQLRKAHVSRPSSMPMEVTVIPAPRRHQRVWSPGDRVTAAVEDVESPENQEEPINTTLRSQHTSTSGRRDSGLSVVVIPPPRRGQRTWSPDDITPTSQATQINREPILPVLNSGRVPTNGCATPLPYDGPSVLMNSMREQSIPSQATSWPADTSRHAQPYVHQTQSASTASYAVSGRTGTGATPATSIVVENRDAEDDQEPSRLPDSPDPENTIASHDADTSARQLHSSNSRPQGPS